MTCLLTTGHAPVSTWLLERDDSHHFTFPLVQTPMATRTSLSRRFAQNELLKKKVIIGRRDESEQTAGLPRFLLPRGPSKLDARPKG